MRFRTPPLSFLLLLPLAVGCRNNRGDVLEAEVRGRDRELRELRTECDTIRTTNEALERELYRQRGIVPPPNLNNRTPDRSALPAGLREVALGSGTGGIDDDRAPGDEALMVVIVPKDDDGQSVRAVGAVTITAREIDPQGAKTFLSSWEISATDLRRYWKSGLLSTGYSITLPWKKVPTRTKMRVEVRFVSPDGRVYEAERDITIRPPAPGSGTPGGTTPANPAEQPADSTTPPEGLLPANVLPMPAPVSLRDAIRIRMPVPSPDPNEP